MSEAWKGMLEFLGASWSDRDGRMASFRVVDDDDGDHPFKGYTKRRGKRPGTRFTVQWADIGAAADATAKSCEVMLAGWTENASGRTVRLFVDPEPDEHPFSIYTRATSSRAGDHLACVFTPLTDDDEDDVPDEKRKTQRLSNVAAMYCRSEDFQEYCKAGSINGARAYSEEDCAELVRDVCGIASRSELDDNERAAELFHQRIRVPFARWMEQTKGVDWSR